MHPSRGPETNPSLRRGHIAAGFAHSGFLAATLFFSLPRQATAESALHYKFQHYAEASDRIKVVSMYGLAEIDLDTITRLRARGVLDTITGMTPTGQPAPVGSDQVPLARLEDRRHAIVTDLTRIFGETTVRAEYAYSDEDDYVSNGISLTLLQDLNRKNTRLQLGLAYTDDDIQPTFFPEARRKLSRDFIAGITQLLDENTTLTANISYGTADGYLSDPYKLVRKNVELLPGLPLPLTFPENRPGSRRKVIGFLEVQRYFARAHGSLEASYRALHDNHGIDSDTLELAWFQRFGERWVVRPAIRFYQQGAADYYHYDLDTTPIMPVAQPDPRGINYSSDYRLSRFRATTLGVKVTYQHGDAWSVDAQFEHYDMDGRDGVTPQSAYASANIFSVGFIAWF